MSYGSSGNFGTPPGQNIRNNAYLERFSFIRKNMAADAMADPRVIVLQNDVGDVLRESRGGFDSIILDVDNGPAALSFEGNNRLYDFKDCNWPALPCGREVAWPFGRLPPMPPLRG